MNYYLFLIINVYKNVQMDLKVIIKKDASKIQIIVKIHKIVISLKFNFYKILIIKICLNSILVFK